MSLNYKGFIELLHSIKVEDQAFNYQLNEIKKTIKNELIKLFLRNYPPYWNNSFFLPYNMKILRNLSKTGDISMNMKHI
jgi:hypothetical protein